MTGLDPAPRDFCSLRLLEHDDRTKPVESSLAADNTLRVTTV